MDEEEDLRHFLLTCESLQNVREKHLRKTKTYLDNIKLGIYSKLKEEGYLLQLIMDCTHNTLNFESVMKRYYYRDIESLTRKFCGDMHMSWVKQMAGGGKQGR